MKIVSKEKLSYTIDKIKEGFSPIWHEHENYETTSSAESKLAEAKQYTNTELAKKISISQGSENAGKIFAVSSEGNAILTNPPTGAKAVYDATQNVIKFASSTTMSGNVSVDSTLTTAGDAADAKVVGNKITQLSERVDAEKIAREQADNVLSARIDVFTSLPEGATTGDAELADAKVDKDGNTHANVGEHIRTVGNQLSEHLEATDLDELKIYKFPSRVLVATVTKNNTLSLMNLDTDEPFLSDRMMIAYKLKILSMNCEKCSYVVGSSGMRPLKITDVGREVQYYHKAEGVTKNGIIMLFIGNVQAYTNGVKNTYLTDSEDVLKVEIYDVRLIDFSKTKKGYEVSTNYEYQIEDVFADRLIVDESEYVKHERNIHGFGDNLMVSGLYRNQSWIQNLYMQGYKLNISYDGNDNGHIANKTSNSIYSSTSHSPGFVSKIVDDTVQVGDDITIFALGSQDYSQNTQGDGDGYCRLGDIGARELDGNYNWCTVTGAIETILKKVTTDTNKRFLWVNVPHSKYGIDTDLEYSLREENNAIEQACKNWGISVSDVYGKMGMNASNVYGKNLWDGQYTDNVKYDASGNLVADELYFVTSKVSVSDKKRYKSSWVSSDSNDCYMTCFDANGKFIRNNAPNWSILPSGTTHIAYNVPKTSSPNGFIYDEDEAMTTDSTNLTDKSYRRYLQIINEDLKQLILQDE